MIIFLIKINKKFWLSQSSMPILFQAMKCFLVVDQELEGKGCFPDDGQTPLLGLCFVIFKFFHISIFNRNYLYDKKSVYLFIILISFELSV